MNQPIVFMFSGQGSQYYQMGKELFAHNAAFRQKMLDLDDFAVSRFGYSVLKEVYHTGNRLSDPFDRLLFSHPAILWLSTHLHMLWSKEAYVPIM